MGMSTKAIKVELAAIDQRIVKIQKADAEMIDNLQVEKIEELAQEETLKLKRARLTVAITRPILSVGVELSAIAFTICVFAISGIVALLLADVMTQFAFATAHIAPESMHGVFLCLACYGAMIYAWLKETPRITREMREWLFEPFRQMLKNNPQEPCGG